LGRRAIDRRCVGRYRRDAAIAPVPIGSSDDVVHDITTTPLEHDPEKWNPVSQKTSCSNEKPDHDSIQLDLIMV
jgi:hypothetical protein